MGKGKDTGSNVTVGSCWALGFGIFFLVFVLPVLITGIILVETFEQQQFNETVPYLSTLEQSLYKSGVTFIVLSVIVLVAGVFVAILIFTGCCNAATSHPGIVFQQNSPDMMAQTQQTRY